MKNFIIIVLAALCAYLLFFRKEPKQIEAKIPEEAKELVKSVVEDVNSKIDKKGFEHAVIEDVQNTIKTVYEIDTSARRERDSVVKLLRLKEGQLKEWRQYAVTWRDSFLTAKRINDSVFRYNDGGLAIEYVLPGDTVKKGYFNYNYNADISHAEYRAKNGLLSRKKHYIDFWVNDKRASINGVKRLKFEVKEPTVRVDVNAHSFYTDRLNIGLDGGVTIGRYRIGGGYYYDFLSGQWRPLVSAKYRIIEF